METSTPYPGPYTPKFPCGVCGMAVKWGQMAACCDQCDLWYHTECMGMTTVNYEALLHSSCSWICCQCGLPNFASSLFQDSSLNLSNSFDGFSSLSSDNSRAPMPGPPIAASSPSQTINSGRLNTRAKSSDRANRHSKGYGH